MPLFTFTPDIELISHFAPTAEIGELADEVGVYSASPSFIRTHCGPLTIALLNLVPSSFYDECDNLDLLPNCDVRIHRLYPGDFPAYPGWHCDGEFRATYHSQPDLSVVPLHHSIIGSISSDPKGVSNTLLLDQPLTVPIFDQTNDETLWSQVHTAVEGLPSPNTKLVPDGQLVKFSSMTLHKATPTRIRGWRLFFRMGMWHRDYLDNAGRISRQEQVYKLHEGSGW